ncbi:MAG TPA: hypothetical protein VKH42_16000 [Vicinamibacterales bacterium]|nr:hypothetical protein [Vicinamibacterales bacterium]
MSRISYAFVVTTLSMATAIACREASAPPAGPSAVAAASAGAGVDGATLKATAPVATAPIGGVKVTQNPVTLTIQNSTTPYSTGIVLSYRFEVLSGTTVVDSGVVTGGANTTTRTVTGLEGEKTYQWHARAVYQSTFGPWSTLQSFVAPVTEGYIRGTELYDPLTSGKTVGSISGPVTFIPGVGVRLDSVGSFITYPLQGTLGEGEFSALFTNVTATHEEILRRLLAMREGSAAINDNPYRMTVGVDSNGEFDWRFITFPSFIKTEGDAQRPRYPFDASKTYFVTTTWRSGFFHVVFKEGGANGNVIYDFGKPYTDPYRPNPHNAYVGNPYFPGDRGERVSCALAIIRQVWLSASPRPSFANQ